MNNSDAPFVFLILLIFGAVLASIVYEQNHQQAAPITAVTFMLPQTLTPVSTSAQQTNQLPAQPTPQGR